MSQIKNTRQVAHNAVVSFKEIKSSDLKNPRRYVALRHELLMDLKDSPGNFHEWFLFRGFKDNGKVFVMLVKGHRNASRNLQ